MVLRILIYHIFISQVQTNCTRVVGRGRIFELTLEMTKFPEGLLKRKLWVGRQYFLTLFWYADIRYICSEAFRWVVVWDTHPCLIKEPISWDWVDTRWVSKFQKTPAEVTGPIGRQGQSVYKQGVKFLLLAAEELQTPCFGLLRFFFFFFQTSPPRINMNLALSWQKFQTENCDGFCMRGKAWYMFSSVQAGRVHTMLFNVIELYY